MVAGLSGERPAMRHQYQHSAQPTQMAQPCVNLLGFVIVAMFVATWVIALAIWRLGRIEERWSAHLENSRAVD